MKKTFAFFLAAFVVSVGAFAEKPRSITLVTVSKETFAFINERGLVELCPEYAIDDSLNVSFLETFTSDSGSADFTPSGLARVSVKRGSSQVEYRLIDHAGKTVAEAAWVTNMIPGIRCLEDGYIGVVIDHGDTLEYRLLDRDQKLVHSIRHARKEAVSEYRSHYNVYRLVKGVPFVAFRDENAKWGLIDREGTVILEPSFDDITILTGIIDRFVANKGKMTSVYSLEGRKIRDLGSGIKVFDSEGLIPFRTASGKAGLYARDFSVAVKPTYEYLSAQHEEMREFTRKIGKDELIGLMDVTGKEVVPPKYGYVNSFDNGYASVRQDGRYLAIDRTGATVFDFSTLGVTEVGPFNDGYAYAKKDNRYGFVDVKGNPVPTDPAALATVVNAGKNGVPGIEAILAALMNPFRFFGSANFSGGLAYVKLQRFLFAIDENKRVMFIIPIY